METEAPKTATEVTTQAAPQQQEAPKVDLSKIEAMLNKVNERLDSFEKNKYSSKEIRRLAEARVIEGKIDEEQESIQFESRAKALEKQKTMLEIRNEKWEALTNKFLYDEIPRTHIRSALMDEGGESGLGQMLSLALFRYMAPNNGISTEDLDSMSLLMGEKAFKFRNNAKEIIRMQSRR